MRVLVTGAAGFIGMHVSKNLLERGDEVIGLDNLNDYYSPTLKTDRLNILNSYENFKFFEIDIIDGNALDKIFSYEKIERVIHLAAQAGVRYSLSNPKTYIQSNIVGFINILESCRLYNIEHLVYASSSSVYGANTKMPFAENDNVDHPVSIYAASKKSNELMAHSYSHLYGLPTTGLRYFTVYGPWGRPDMSPWLFTSAIINEEPIKVFNHGNMMRDFTYIDDIAKGTVMVLDKIASPDGYFDFPTMSSAKSAAPYRIYNIGQHKPIQLMDFIETLEGELAIKAKKKFLPMQPGDVLATYADVSKLEQEINFLPDTTLQHGVRNWVKWYRSYNKK